jgi:hypothetical protein
VRPNLRYLSIVMKLAHGHIFDFKEPDAFIDAALAHQAFPKISALNVIGHSVVATSTEPMVQAQLNFTTDIGPWDKRNWTTIDATSDGNKIRATIPDSVATNPQLTLLLTAKATNDVRFSSEYAQPSSGN